jgi:acetoin utilization protein AcuB
MQPLTVRAVMSGSPFTIGARQSLAEARRLLEQHHVRHLPVVEEGRLVGVLSERDLGAWRFGDALPVSSAMSPDPYAVSPRAPLDGVAREMSRRRIGSAVIVDRGKVVGVFTTVDALRVLWGLLAEEADA